MQRADQSVLREPAAAPPNAIPFDQDGTLVTDVPYSSLTGLVRPLRGVADALAALRADDIPTGVITNQSGVAGGLLSETEVHAVNSRVDELLGPFDVWKFCPHGPADGCRCRKPAPGMILQACRKLGRQPEQVVPTLSAAVAMLIGGEFPAQHPNPDDTLPGEPLPKHLLSDHALPEHPLSDHALPEQLAPVGAPRAVSG